MDTVRRSAPRPLVKHFPLRVSNFTSFSSIAIITLSLPESDRRTAEKEEEEEKRKEKKKEKKKRKKKKKKKKGGGGGGGVKRGEKGPSVTITGIFIRVVLSVFPRVINKPQS